MDRNDALRHGLPVAGLKAHIIDVKFEKGELDALTTRLNASGIIAVSTPAEADVVATKLGSALRIAKHLDLSLRDPPPVVSMDWLEQWYSIGAETCPPLENATIALSEFASRSVKDEIGGALHDFTRKRPRSPVDIIIVTSGSQSPPPFAPPSKRPHLEAPPSPVGPKQWISSDSDGPSDDHDHDGASEDEVVFDSDDDDDGDYDRDLPLHRDFKNVAYECLRPHPLNHHNKGLTDLLSLMEKQRELDGEARNALSYRRAISALISYPCPITSWKEAKKMKGVGNKIALLIREYLKTGTIQVAAALRENTRFLVVGHFATIYGVGPSTAREWYAKGYRSIQDVLDGEPNLPAVVKIGIEMWPDFDKKMARVDVEEVQGLLRTVLDGLGGGFTVVPVGGYRRGKEMNGDCDVVITHPDLAQTQNLLRRLVDALQEQGFIKYILWYGEGHDPKDQVPELRLQSGKKNSFDHLSKASMAAQKRKSVSLFDLIISPYALFPCAVLGWSGSKQFERGLRDWCKRGIKGYHFASHGLFDRKTNRRIDVKSEEEIFEKLKIPWCDPSLRNA
ncbi:hypothetical protein HKX48_003427 [Thoreauomyces humboldtii]|nr:hypothetical protein HKX48_003427 [Thoreauomyces humboldtii]